MTIKHLYNKKFLILSEGNNMTINQFLNAANLIFTRILGMNIGSAFLRFIVEDFRTKIRI